MRRPAVARRRSTPTAPTSSTPGVGDKNQNDTFTYKATDGSLQATGTVTVAITNNLVWYVDRDAGSTATGRSHSPLQNLAGINGAGGAGDSDGANDVIFLYDSATAYTGGLPLEASQLLTGEPQGLTVNAVSLVPAAGSNPVIQNAGGTAITLANSNVIRRINVGTSSGDGISGHERQHRRHRRQRARSAASPARTSSSPAATARSPSARRSRTPPGAPSTSRTAPAAPSRSAAPISDTGTGVFLDDNANTTVDFTGDLDVSSGTSPAFTATDGGTVTAVGAGKTLATTTGTALTVSATTIGSGGMNFQSIAANGAANGIVLANTGTTAGLTVAGTGAANSGGIIQNTTGAGILLTNTDAVSLTTWPSPAPTRPRSRAPASPASATRTDRSPTPATARPTPCHGAFAFNSNASCFGGTTSNNIDGVVTITNNTITNPYGGGIDIRNFSGTISDAVITGNTLTTPASQADSAEDAIAFELAGTTTAVASLTKATIQNNSITGFPSGRGIVVQGGNATGDGVGEAAPPGTYGTPGTANVINITGNLVQGDPTTGVNGVAIGAGVDGRGQGNFSITNNGTAANPLANVLGVGIGTGAAGSATVTFVVTGNFLAPNNIFNSAGIGVSTDKNIQGDAQRADHPADERDGQQQHDQQHRGRRHPRAAGQLQRHAQPQAAEQHHQLAAPVVRRRSASRTAAPRTPAFNPTLCATISGNTANSGPADAFGDKPPGINLTKRSTTLDHLCVRHHRPDAVAGDSRAGGDLRHRSEPEQRARRRLLGRASAPASSPAATSRAARCRSKRK